MDLRQRSDVLIKILDEAYNGVLITSSDLDPPGPRIVYANPAFSAITGYTAEEVQGQTPRILQGPDTKREVLDRLRARLEAGKTFEGATTNYRKDGTPFTLEWTASPVWDAQGSIEYYIAVQRDITQRIQAQQTLAEREAHYRDLVENYPDFVMRFRPDGTISFANPNLRGFAEEALGIAAGELEGGNWLDLLPEGSKAEAEEHLGTFGPNRPIQVFEVRLPNPAGQARFIRWIHSAFFDDDGGIDHFQSVGVDITERKETDRKLNLAASVYNHASEGIMITDANGDVVAVNPAFTEITGYTEAEALGRNPRFLQSGYQDAAFYAAMWQTIHEEGRWTGEVWDRHKDGRIVQEWLNVTSVYDAAGAISHYVAVFKDITSLQETKQELQFLANRDPLTHAANRRLLHSSLDQAMDRADREGRRVAVLVLDVEGFKRINDVFGHPEGDEVLIETAKRLASNIRSTDTLGRQGGDEFAVIMDGFGPPEAAGDRAQALIGAMEEPFRVGNRDIGLGASIGISVYPDDAADKEVLFSYAETALLEAEKAGKGKFAYYQSEMTRRVSERLLLEQDLRKGIDRDELVLHFQTQNRLEDATVVGLEVLVRWNHPEQGLLTPDRFIPVAEEGNLISALTQWVCRHACWQGRRWLDAGQDFGRLSINISATDFQRMDLPGFIEDTLVETGFPAERLTLEVTEGALAQSDETTLSELHKLKDLGVSLAVDDFGTGYSSLAYLQRLPIDVLKIDKGFVAGVPEDANDAAIVRAVLNMGAAMGLAVVAEGVETAANRDFLRETGCLVGQGFLWGKPSPQPFAEQT